MAAPLSTLVPRKQIFANSSGAIPVRVSRASSFSTGNDSPVSVACEMNKSFAEMSRTSAGIMSPAAELHHIAGHQLLERDFLFLSGAHHRRGQR